MNTITIIKPLNLYSKMGGIKGALMKPLLYLILPIWFLASILVAIIADNIIMGLVAFLALLMGIAAVIVLFSGGEYKPEKSFSLWRLSKEKLSKYFKYYTIGGIAVLVLLSLYEFKVQYVFYLLSIYAAFYYAYKSFALHEDVDYVTNNQVADLLGMEIDEKVQASYQNFDASSVQEGSSMLLLSDKKIMFAYYNGSKWTMLNKMLKEITEIGRVNTDGVVNLTSSSVYFYVGFSDNTSLGLHMDLYDKITSNPNLFFKKFLIVLDTFLMGKADEKITSRRRISVNKDSNSSTTISTPNVETRSLDISNTILSNLSNAAPIESGRVLEF